MSCRSPGEQRRRKAARERKRAEVEAIMNRLRSAGATCATCKHFEKATWHLKTKICGLHTDFDGYVEAQPDDLCPAYSGGLA